MTTFILWAVFIVLVFALIGFQVATARAAREVGGRMSGWAVALRVLNVVALLALVAWIVYRQVGG